MLDIYCSLGSGLLVSDYLYCSDKRIRSVADPGSGAFLPRDPDPGPRIKKVPDMGSGINILDKISESLETIFWVKNS